VKRPHNWKRVVGTGLIVGLLALAGLAAVASAQGPMGSSFGGTVGNNGFGNMMGGWGNSGFGNMMGGWGNSSFGNMMGGWGNGGYGNMMGGWGNGSFGGMMGGVTGNYGDMDPQNCLGSWGNPGNGEALSLDEATQRAEAYVSSLNNDDLVLAEVMAFENNFYAEVKEESTGTHAFELLIHRYTGAVTPEPGPNMMWNTKYGHMSGGFGGMMGGWQNTPGSGAMTVTPAQALEDAQKWLDANMAGTSAADEADAFYGYYTIHTLKDGAVTGMLSVNGYSGDVWYHNWHGDFIDMKTLER